MRVLVVGASGQLGRALLARAPSRYEVLSATRAKLNICEQVAVQSLVSACQPHVIVNAAAYTAVDRAESEADTAFAVNAGGAENLAVAAGNHSAHLIQISTDFVFDGKSAAGYAPDSVMRPLNVYGASKMNGEVKIRELIGSRATVVRTSWVYANGGANFVNKMLELMAAGKTVYVVCDQIGTPTWAVSLADAVWAMIDADALGITHHWTDSGVASWYDFAVAIRDRALAAGILRNPPHVEPVTTEEYPTKATRPRFSVLDKTSTWSILGKKANHWMENLERMLQERSHG